MWSNTPRRLNAQDRLNICSRCPYVKQAYGVGMTCGTLLRPEYDRNGNLIHWEYDYNRYGPDDEIKKYHYANNNLMKKLSILIPMYNSELCIEKCLDSVLNQNIDEADVEILVMDDASTDSSVKFVKKYTQKYNNIIVCFLIIICIIF